MLYEHYLDLIDEVAELMRDLAQHPDAAVRDKLTELMQRLDMVHREGLLRLVDALRAQGAGHVLDRARDDDLVIRILLGLYDMAELPAEPEANAGTTTFFPRERLTFKRAKNAC